ncbi:hypothetical protein EZS27_002885 [termite gut metagenome]|uniref:IPT/TIG domain-containing protein n=1 Tax=termite gut metagenome TaxID=433724 RepID=A0A5J4SWZ2_9ZZZZ
MKTKSIVEGRYWRVHWMLLMLIVLCFGSCKDDDQNDSGGEFDPSQPVLISDFEPKTGGLGTRLILSGENFGTDVSKIKVTIGGVNAKVIGSNGTSIYCIVPEKAYEGDIQLSIVDDENEKIAGTQANIKFTYEKKMLVTTFLGTMYNNNTSYDTKDGPFDNCGGFGGVVWLSFDPKNHDHLYLVGEQHPTRLIDFAEKYVRTVYSGLSKVRTICWTQDADSMIITNDQGTATNPNNYVLSRSSGFRTSSVLTNGRNCNGAETHPVNGELYFNSYDAGQVWRYDFETGESKPLFSIQDSGWEFSIQFHPSGNYAYIIVINQSYILRSDYDWVNHTLTTPYIVCGTQGQHSWNDAVGKSARLNRPRQGTFVINPKYEEREDKYDFYFCDRENHCIRILSPDGRVTTFAGRGSNGTSGYVDGDLRMEARFNHPEGIVYDEERQCFFVGDRENRRIRKIGYEE